MITKTLVAVLLGSALLLSGCATGTVNYPPLVDAFGKVSDHQGQVGVSRNGQILSLEVDASVFVGDTVTLEESAWVEIVLAPGQVLRLSENANWEITEVISNGAAYGSDTRLMVGKLVVSGKEYMPHRIIVRTPQAEITTFSENFLISVGHGASRVQSLDESEIRVSNAEGSLVLKESFQLATVRDRNSPEVTQSSGTGPGL